MDSRHNRILWIDYLKGICMISIILNHLDGPDFYGRITYPFELAGFFFASGYTFNPRNNFRDFLVAKLKTLVLPIFIFGLINTLISSFFKESNIADRIIGIIIQVPGKWDDLWFIACLFSMELIFYFTLKAGRNFMSQCCIYLSLPILGYLSMTYSSFRFPWHLENACIMIPFMWLGHMLKLQSNRNGNDTSGKTLRICLMALSFVVYLSSISARKNYPIDIHLLDYGNFLIFAVSALSGLCLTTCLSKFLESFKNSILLKFLSFIGINTLVYYAFQSKVISLIQLLCSGIGFDSESYTGVIVCCLIVNVILMIPAAIIRKYFPFMLGKF